MPDGIYLNAKALGVEEVAEQMNDLIHNPPRYYDFFKWHSYYSFHDTDDDQYRNAVCGLCALLNNRTRRVQRTVYTNITEWWNSSVWDLLFFIYYSSYTNVYDQCYMLYTSVSPSLTSLDFSINYYNAPSAICILKSIVKLLKFTGALL